MNTRGRKILTVVAALMIVPFVTMGVTAQAAEWLLSNLKDTPLSGQTQVGTLRTIDSPYGKAVYFDGAQDCMWLDKNPLDGLTEFTIEVIFQPAEKAPYEQRFLHMGQVNGDRMLLETRWTDIVADQWVFEAAIIQSDKTRMLIDKKLVYPTGKWYHVAAVVNGGNMDTYVDYKHELKETGASFTPFIGGQMSIGCRQNKVSWFKGAIYKIRITPKVLSPAEFMKN